jgi:4-amino-4-deoxy-L-arabinose transferase-like glycosyltransferase
MASFRTRLGLVAVLGLMVRLVAAYLNRHHVVAGDALTFHIEGHTLAAGEGFRRVYEDVPTAEHPPAHIVVLAAADLLGLDGFTAQRLFQGVLGTLTVIGCGLVGRRAAGEATGLVAAGIAAVYPMLWMPDTALMSETTYGVMIVGTLLAALSLRERPSGRRAAVLGAAIALAALTRGEALALLVVLLVPTAWMACASDRRAFARWTAVGVGAFALVLAPWAIRNALTFDARVLISTNGDGVWVGSNCPATYDGPLIGSWVFACYGTRPPGDEAQQSVAYRERGLRYARDHAGRVPVVVAARLGRLLDVYRPWTQGVFFNATEGRGSRASKLGLLAWWLLAPLAVAGAVLLRRRRAVGLGVQLGPVVMVLCVGAAVYGSTRFRFAAEPSVVVLAAVAVQALAARAARRLRPLTRASGSGSGSRPAPAEAPRAPAPGA